VFLQEFGWSADKWSESSLPQVLSTQNATEIVQQSLEGTRVFVSSSSEETLAELELTGKSNASVAEPFTAGTLIKLAYSKLVDGIDANPMAISPLYVAEPVINLPAIKRP